MKALILCNDFPPINSIGAERPYSWFLYFKENGIYPIIITKNWKGESNSPEKKILNFKKKTENEKTAEGHIIKVPHRIILPEKMILKYGINRFNLFRKFLTFIYKFLSFHFTYFDQHSNIYFEAKKYLKKNKVNFIIITGEPNILFKYGYLIKLKYKNIKYIADFRDGWFFDHVSSLNKSIINKLMRNHEYLLEIKYMKNTDLITSVDPLLCENLNKLHKKKTACIYNGFWEYVKEDKKYNNSKLILTHSGTLTPGQRVEYLIESLIELIDENKIKLNDFEVRFIGLKYYPIQVNRLKKISEKINSTIIYTKRIPKKEVIKYNLESDFLLTFTDKNYDAIYAKTYNYIECKRKILVIPDDKSILGNLITRHGIGYNFQDKEEIKLFLINKIREKKNNILDSSLKEIDNLNFFKRSNQARIFSSELLNL